LIQIKGLSASRSVRPVLHLDHEERAAVEQAFLVGIFGELLEVGDQRRGEIVLVPPEYTSATAAPVSGSPSASAAVIDRSAIASTPSRPDSESGKARFDRNRGMSSQRRHRLGRQRAPQCPLPVP
jgi:hypothetical protein